MRRNQLLILGVFLGALGILSLSATAQSQRATQESLPQRLARMTKLSEGDAAKFFEAIGPAIVAELEQGKTVSVPGLGSFRIVRVPEHRDLRDGRPVVIPASNTIDFEPSGGVSEAVNAEGSQPAETVPAFKYNILPGQTPGQKVPRTRAPNVRTR